ncbi:reverse transcriptase domain-containing protein [Tanacetum coccineum]
MSQSLSCVSKILSRTGKGDGRTGRRGGRTGEPTRRVGECIGLNEGNDKVPDFSMGDVKGVNVGNDQISCLYKEFMVCNPKDYDRKGGAIVYTRWIEKMESVQDMSRCGANQKVKYTVNSFIGKALTWWNTQVQTKGWEAVVGMTWEDFKVLMSKEFCPNNEMQKLETEF